MLYKNKICPCCKCHISLLRLLYLKDKSSFYCFNCKKKCEIILNNSVKVLFSFVAVFSVLIMCTFVFLFKKILIGTFILFLLFTIFYILVPNFIYIKPSSRSEFFRAG